jgi:hypothetical protein
MADACLAEHCRIYVDRNDCARSDRALRFHQQSESADVYGTCPEYLVPPTEMNVALDGKALVQPLGGTVLSS